MRLLLVITLLVTPCSAQAEITFLRRDGKLRVAVNARVIAELKREGWVELPSPWDPVLKPKPRKA